MPSPLITQHAIERAIERCPGVATEDQARVLLTSHAVQVAISFGAPTVKLGTGQHVVIKGGKVITVLPKSAYASHLGRVE